MIKIVDFYIDEDDWSGALSYRLESNINEAIDDLKKEGYILDKYELHPPSGIDREVNRTQYNGIQEHNIIIPGKFVMFFKQTALSETLNA